MPKIVRNDFVERTDAEKELLGHYQRAATKLVQVISSTPANPHRATRQKQLAAVLAILKKLDKTTADWVEKNIPKMYRKGITDTSADFSQFKEKGFKIYPFGGVNEKAVAILVDETKMAFGNTILTVKRSAERAITNIQKTALQNAIIRDTIAGETGATTKKEIIDELKSKGVEALKSKPNENGYQRTFRLEDYADILVRSQTMKAYNSGIIARSLGAGRRFMRVSKVTPDVDGQDVCNDHEGEIVDLLDPNVILPPFHPRCRHILIPVSFAELKAERPDLYEIALKYYQESE